MSLADINPVAAAVTMFPALPAPSPMKYISSFSNLKLLFVVISLLKNFISGPYNSVSSLLTPGIILSNLLSPSSILVTILCGSTSDKSPATQSFSVGSIKPLFIFGHVLLLPLLRSFRDWIIGFESPSTFAILAIASPYSLVLVTGSVRLTFEINAKLLLFDYMSFSECPFTHIYP